MGNELVIIDNETGEIIEQQDWYQLLIEDCKAIITEARFNSNWVLIEGYHLLGERLVTDENYQEYAKGNKSSVKRVSRNLNCSPRTIYKAMQFYKKYPDINMLPGGKNITWRKIANNLLTEGSKDLDAKPKEDKALELLKKWGTKLGQIWKIGEHQLICGDCNDLEIVELATNIIEPTVIITDPPYGKNHDTDYSKLPSTKWEGNKDFSPIIGDDEPFDYRTVKIRCNEEFWFGADYYNKTLPSGGSWLVWDKRVEEQFDKMIGSAFELIWSKQDHKRQIIRHNNTLFSGKKEARNKLHPTTKPTPVIEWIIKNHTLKSDVIMDMYAGSGSTILACENLDRRCIAIEIDPKYVAVSLERWMEATDNIPILLRDKNGWNN